MHSLVLYLAENVVQHSLNLYLKPKTFTNMAGPWNLCRVYFQHSRTHVSSQGIQRCHFQFTKSNQHKDINMVDQRAKHLPFPKKEKG